ncbi:hypothetical protein VKT23_013282 [Stygiomarasmius scandens]|uniref:F-box domain-containing protein n=1 Tax=Marasmiellus scandens TaxID=2682957 RepID=A0ABR1J6Q3_9AGAR
METPDPFNPNLLTTNAVPFDDDIHRVRQICAEHSQDLNRLNAQIERLQESLDTITSKRDALQSRLSTLQSITSPLRALPPEVLQTIFIKCLEPFPIISAHESPVLLTQICSKWRSIAIDTPALWASFHIAIVGAKHPFESYDSTCKAIRDGLQTFLSRSHSLPLNISVCSGFSPGPYNEDIIREVNRTLEVLLPYHGRWKYLKLQVPQQCMASIEHLSGEGLPNLETAVMYCCAEGTFPQPVTLSQKPFFENAPRLRRLSIGARDHAIVYKLLGTAVSWVRLTHLIISFSYWELSPRPLEDIADVLNACANLEECCITFPGTELETFSPRNPVIILPKLKTVALDCYFPSHMMICLLDLLVLPELKELIIGGNHLPNLSSDAPVISSVVKLIQRSSCLLTHFGFKDDRGVGVVSESSPAVEHMISLLKSMPELKALNFSHTWPMTEALLKAFSNVSLDSGEILCPKLARIEFSDSASVTEQTLVHFLSMRLSPPATSVIEPLGGVVIEDARPASDSLFAQFGDSVQFNTLWYAGSHTGQNFRRPTSRAPERVLWF